MKKSLFFLCLLFIVLLLPLVLSAIDFGEKINPETGLPYTAEQLQKINKDYLKQEWGKILEKNNYTRPIVMSYRAISPVSNPVIYFLFGMEPQVSWLFILTVTLWIAFVFYFLGILEIASIFSGWLQTLLSFVVVIGISLSGITKKIAEYIINAISLLNTWWMQLIVAVVVVVALILASVFSKNIKEFFKALKESREKAKEVTEKIRLEGAMKSAEEMTKAFGG